MENTVVLVAACIITLVVCAALFLLVQKIKSRINALETQLASSEFVVNELKQQVQQKIEQIDGHQEQLKEWQLEHQQVSQQLEHRTKVLQEKLLSIKDEIAQIQQQQPENRLYTRAQKMVALGADVDEIVKECDLPLAEAEILITMHRKGRK